MTEPFSPRDRLGRLEAGAPRENAQTALVRRYFEMWNTGEGAVADQVLGPRYVDHAHPAVIGPAAARSIAPRFHRANGRMSPEILGADGEFVAVRNKIRKTHDGKVIEVEGKALFRIDEGRIVEQWSWYSSPADKARLFRDSARSV
jgi:predicted SnoaL-like aldol condensation-catalyzing enzyme